MNITGHSQHFSRRAEGVAPYTQEIYEVSVSMDIMVVDGNSIINRAFYGVKPLSTKEGVPTHAVYGFLAILRRLLDDYKPDGLCVAFDLPAPTFRHKLYDGYKATRKGMPEELAVQMPLLREVLGALNVPCLSLEGYEADDILGTLSARFPARGSSVSLVTGDRDSFQLISPDVRVLHVGNNATKICDEAAIEEAYGLRPAQLIDLKALMGDSSDNVPGVPGVGEKTALNLMHQYGGLDEIYAHVGEISGKLKDKLEAGRDMAYLSKQLVTIDTDVPVEASPESVARKSPDGQALRALFTRLEFTRALDKWLPKEDRGEQPSLFDVEETPLPDGVGRNVKAMLRAELDAGKPLTPYRADVSIAAWLLQGPERDWGEMEAELREQGLWKLFELVEMPLCEVLASMEHLGIKVDRQALVGYGQALDGMIVKVERQVYEDAEEEFNIGSPKQLGAVLFEKLQLPHGKKNKTGWSTDADTLQKLRLAHPVVDGVLEYRGLTKLKSTYADGLLKVMDAQDHIHSTFQMTSTITGRLSSTEPNLQNIPVRTELGGRLREMFIPSKPGWVLVDADYSQIELRVLAHIADDAAMKAAFRSGEDIHAVTASQVFGVPLDAVTPTMRRHAKAVNFGIVYGISAFSLSEDIGVSVAEAKRYIDNYLERFSGVRAYMTDIVEQAKAQGYVTTLLGRRRNLPELKSSNYNLRSFGERAALNTPIQGTAADIIKLAMVAVYNRLRAERLEARLLLQVHDELIVECPEAESERVTALLREDMENVFPLDPPLVADAHWGRNWAEAK